MGPNNFFVRARGTVGDVESAFHVVLNNYEVRGKVVRSNNRDPFVEGPAAQFVRSISGLDSGEYEHPLMARGAPPTAKNGAAALHARQVWRVQVRAMQRSSARTAFLAPKPICFPATPTVHFPSRPTREMS